MAKITQKEMYANRLKVVEWLKKPSLKKAREQLRNENGGRCCLGHACDALGIEYKIINGNYWYHETDMIAPKELVKSVGFHDTNGRTETGYFDVKSLPNYNRIRSLVELNDEYKISPQKIGEYLESVILGGDNTPWIAIKKPKGI